MKPALLSFFVRALMARCLALALVLPMTGCGYWGRRPIDLRTPLKPDDAVWVWSHDAVSKWHDVVISQDSVSGIPFGTSRDCYARCRRSIPRVQVDSMKQGYRTFAQKVVEPVGIAAGVIVADIALCTLVRAITNRCW
jgi:hypothetical protein